MQEGERTRFRLDCFAYSGVRPFRYAEACHADIGSSVQDVACNSNLIGLSLDVQSLQTICGLADQTGLAFERGRHSCFPHPLVVSALFRVALSGLNLCASDYLRLRSFNLARDVFCHLLVNTMIHVC